MSANLSSPAVLSALLDRHGLDPRKRLGQHFLVDFNILKQILEAADLTSNSLTLEIGPGPGVLTCELASIAGSVVAIEKDWKMIQVLEETTADLPNVHILEGDAVRILGNKSLPEIFPFPILPGSVSCVSNLPYGVTTPIIGLLLAQKNWFNNIVLMVQLEVARRLVAKPGVSDYGALSVFAQFNCSIELVSTVGKNSFMPPPKVESAIVRMRPVHPSTVTVKSADRFIQISRALFGQRRKTSLNALRSLHDHPERDQIAAALQVAGIPPDVRGEKLGLLEIAAIADALPLAPLNKRPDDPVV